MADILPIVWLIGILPGAVLGGMGAAKLRLLRFPDLPFDGYDYTMSGILGVLIGLIWPVAFAALAFGLLVALCVRRFVTGASHG